MQNNAANIALVGAQLLTDSIDLKRPTGVIRPHTSEIQCRLPAPSDPSSAPSRLASHRGRMCHFVEEGFLHVATASVIGEKPDEV
jgi:hypothetical protein